jgi:hypothetical protein
LPRVLYRWPELLTASERALVFVTEGEKDADRLADLGLVATTNPGGAGKWHLVQNLTPLRGRQVVILPDSDEPGRRHAQQVAQSLHQVAESVRVLELPSLPPKGDVSDWLDQGHTKEELLELAEQAPQWAPSPGEDRQGRSLRLVRLDDVLQEPEEEVAWLWSQTLPAGGLSVLAAKPKVGKSTLARNLALAIAQGDDFLDRPTTQGPVVYLALEEKRSEVQRHFQKMGATGAEPILVHFGAAPEEALEELEQAINEHHPALVVIDPIARLLRVRDWNNYGEVTRALEPVLTLARLSGCHILCVHHAGKLDRAGGDAILGSTALFGGVDTALMMRRKEAGRTLETIQRYGEDIPETVIGFDAETGTVSAPGTVDDVEIAKAKDRIVETIGQGSLTRAEIREAVEGKTKYVEAALRQLLQQEQLVRSGTGKKIDPFVYSVRDSKEDRNSSWEPEYSENTAISIAEDEHEPPAYTSDIGSFRHKSSSQNAGSAGSQYIAGTREPEKPESFMANPPQAKGQGGLTSSPNSDQQFRLWEPETGTDQEWEEGVL